MTEYNSLLKFALPDPSVDTEQFVDPLYEEGGDDATAGIGQHGRIALNFTREALSAAEAVSSAIADVRKGIPGAKLVEATPDLVGLTGSRGKGRDLAPCQGAEMVQGKRELRHRGRPD